VENRDRIPDSAIIDLPEGDLPIFRVLPFKYLLDMFKHRKLVLTRPSKWDDPFENFLVKVKVIRYAILKRPMNKWPAIGTCAFFSVMKVGS
jgi:hypothetical protein